MAAEKMVPDTLLLEERGGIAANALVGLADEDYEHIPFFSGYLIGKPAWMSHGNWFCGLNGRLVDALVRARCMSGTRQGLDVEEHYRENLLRFFREDGLAYRRNTFTQETVAEHQARFEESASMIDQRAVMLGVTTWYMATGDARAREAADRQCAALRRIARKERDSWYYPASEYTEHGWPSFDAVHTRLAVDPAAMWGRQVMPLIRWHEFTGNADAFELAENFVANIVHRSGVFNSDGSFNGALEYRNGHFHTRMGTLDAVARFAAFTGDSSLMSWVKRSLDWALSQGTTFGWTPGDMQDQAYEHETCSLVDAISTCLTLAGAGYPEYWGCVERFVRNQLTEAQLLDTAWIEESQDKSGDIPRRKTFYKVAQRLRGAFAGYAAPNDFVYDGQWGRGHVMDVQGCCVASGTRGLHTAWSSIVTECRGRVSVNLLLSRGTRWLDVSSHMPHEGRVDLDINRDLPDLVVRIPEWAPFGGVEVARTRAGETVETTGRRLSWVNQRFMRVGPAHEGERITIRFPLRRRTTVERAVDREFTAEWIGDDVVGIAPPGRYCPLYSGRKVRPSAPMRSFAYKRDEGTFPV
jgi:hypothetical protein